MKITDVKIHHIEWERGPYHWRDEIMPSGPTARTALIRILTDEGVEGISTYSAGASVDEIKYQLIGEDPLDRERIWQKFWRNLRTSKLGPGHRSGGLRAVGSLRQGRRRAGLQAAGRHARQHPGLCQHRHPRFVWTSSWPWPMSAWRRATRPSSCTPGVGCKRTPISAKNCADMWATTSC